MPEFGLGLSLRGRLNTSTSPSALFANGEVGVWFDPSDLSTLFQDLNALTPVTTPGQSTALMLDKSRSSSFGADIIVNGDFSQGATGWTLGVGVTISGGVANIPSGATWLEQLVPTQAGRAYRVTATVVGVSGSFCGTWDNANQNGNLPLLSGGSSATSRNGTFSYTFVAIDTASYVGFTGGGGLSCTVDNVSVIPLPLGSHASQANAPQRFIYGIHPINGLRNLQPQTEDFSAASWTRSTISVSVPGTPAPARGGVYGRITSTGAFANLGSQFVFEPSKQYTVSGVVKKVSGSVMSIVVEGALNPIASLDFDTGVFTRNFCTGTVTALGANDYFLTITFTTPASTAGFLIKWWVGLYSGVSTAGQAFDLAAPTIELGAVATTYQKVVTQYNVTQAGFPSVHYLAADGVDDTMATTALVPNTDKIQIFVGLHKPSDVARGIILELLQQPAVAGTATLQVPAPGAFSYNFTSRGGGLGQGADIAGFPAPITQTFTALGDLAAPRMEARINGNAVSFNTNDQGGGNYLNYPMHIASRGGTSIFFKGRIYQIIGRFGPNLTPGQIASTETFMNRKTGAY